jgi:hypothetical protein
MPLSIVLNQPDGTQACGIPPIDGCGVFDVVRRHSHCLERVLARAHINDHAAKVWPMSA